MNNLAKKFMINVKNPQSNFLGRMQLKRMNNRHFLLAAWGAMHVNFSDKGLILDVGCGGGKNIAKMLKYNKKAQVCGLDYSEASIEMTKKVNRKEIKSGRAKVIMGSAENIPFASNIFDLVTAYETIYFWDIKKGFDEVYRVMKKGAKFLIVNECQNPDGLAELMNEVGFNVYTPVQIKEALINANFRKISMDSHENGQWITVIAEK